MEMATSQNTPNEFSSHDLYLAAFIQANGVPLLRTEREHGRIRFVFRGGPKTHELHSMFLNNTPVPVGDFRRCLTDLKTVIFSTT
jgi:hypothetical protein